jgi:hypothetical protein
MASGGPCDQTSLQGIMSALADCLLLHRMGHSKQTPCVHCNAFPIQELLLCVRTRASWAQAQKCLLQGTAQSRASASCCLL